MTISIHIGGSMVLAAYHRQVDLDLTAQDPDMGRVEEALAAATVGMNALAGRSDAEAVAAVRRLRALNPTTRTQRRTERRRVARDLRSARRQN